MKKLWYLAAAAIAAFAATIAIAPPASAADGFPLGTFKIVNAWRRAGYPCATANSLGTQVVPEPCAVVDLNQQWTWDPSTSHLVNVGTLKCAASTGLGQLIQLQTCNALSPGQQWRAYTYDDGDPDTGDDGGQRITNLTPYPYGTGQGWSVIDGPIALDWTSENFRHWGWTFPLI